MANQHILGNTEIDDTNVTLLDLTKNNLVAYNINRRRNNMSDTSIVLLLGFVGSLICTMTPILKLNASITKLNTTIEYMNKKLEDNDEKFKDHDNRLDNHEIRLDRLEHK